MVRRLSILCCSSLLAFLPPSTTSARESNEAFELDAKIVLSAYAGLVDEHLLGVLNGLKALAATQDAKSGDWERLRIPLQQFGNSLPTQVAVWFAEPNGSYFTVERGRAAGTLSDRDYFPILIRGEDVIGSLVISKSTGARSVIVAAPVVKDGNVIGALGVSISATALAKRVSASIKLPDDVVFYALDRRGLTALHKETDLVFQFPSDLGDESLKSAVRKMLSQPQGTVQYRFRGTRRSVLFTESGSTGWVFALGFIRAD